MSAEEREVQEVLFLILDAVEFSKETAAKRNLHLTSKTFIASDTLTSAMYAVVDFILEKKNKKLYMATFTGCRGVKVTRKDEANWRKAMKAFWQSDRLMELDVPEPTFHLLSRPYGPKMLKFLIQLASCILPQLPILMNDDELLIASQVLKEQVEEEKAKQAELRAKTAQNKKDIAKYKAELVARGVAVDLDTCKDELAALNAQLVEPMLAIDQIDDLPLDLKPKIIADENMNSAKAKLHLILHDTSKLTQALTHRPPAILERQLKEAKRREAELDSVLAIRTKDLAELEEGKKALLEQAPSKVTVVRHIMADLKALCRETTKVNEMVNDKPFTKQRRRPNTILEAEARRQGPVIRRQVLTQIQESVTQSAITLDETLDIFNPQLNSTMLPDKTKNIHSRTKAPDFLADFNLLI